MKKGKEETKKRNSSGTEKSRSLLTDERLKFVGGILVTGFAVYLLFAFIAYLFFWKQDQSQIINGLSDPGVQAKNWSGKSGAWFAELIVGNGFGLGAFFIPLIIGSIGLYMLKFPKIRIWKLIAVFTFAAIILSLILGFFSGEKHMYLGGGLGGAQGYEANKWLNAFLGKLGTGIALAFITVFYLVFALNVSPAAFSIIIPSFLKNKKTGGDTELATDTSKNTGSGELEENSNSGEEESRDGRDPFMIINKTKEPALDGDDDESEFPLTGGNIIRDFENEVISDYTENDVIPIKITKTEADDQMTEQEVQKIMENYDPRLDLSRYKFPPVSILKEHKSSSAFDNTEVIENKENIIKTLGDHKIPIKHISATVGPTVTLYEIVPERGVRLARIKSLENDIALNLSALGIRIIAPIPGRGTVGIEVPNKNPEMVSMRSLISSKAFQETKFDLALALGRTITNDAYIVDLTKMPHLLVAGATGQGKSVAINAIITSILYKKHPSEVKFVLIDPKRVELPLYTKIERHFLAKLPEEEDAIITDTQKVIKTLNSLCIEMDNRLELLKAAQSRHIKEYNEKFTSRKLSPEKGHKYMPYIVLVIDEFADLIMTAGREIEGPIGRLAQLARAIGIHLIISTQRPSANIITGFIKANFPTRIALRVFSSIDSRTILDATGADRLVGRGDMLVSSGSEPVRVQCAFIDTPEIEELTDFIGSQQGYPDAMHLPEYIDDSEAGVLDIDLKKRDNMFDDAAKLVVIHQQGSTSLIQRKLAIGYNRAGRIIDQLEAAGIVGPFEGSKARDVLITDLNSLEQILKRLE
ncbi:MAG: cell division protein FtsK [Odoribacter sp.]|nr:cell division protein FtsK [Odoribacter sp.]